MRKTILLYGGALALLVSLLKYLEYQLVVRDLAIEVYIAVVALFFTIMGAWLGLKLTQQKKVIITHPQGTVDLSQLAKLGISKREYEVLELMAKGLSNQEIADKLFVSLNTVKSHTSNLFVKLNASRRTQAIQIAKNYRLIS